MSKPTDIERVSQNRVVKLFQEELNYTYLGDWEEREGNSNIEEEYLTNYLERKGYSNEHISKAIFDYSKQPQTLVIVYTPPIKTFTANQRNGVKVKVSAGENYDTS